MKTCFKCNETKPYSEFYKHSQMGDGYLGKCKSCTKTDVTGNRNNNLSYYREYDSIRSKTDKRKECLKRTVKKETASRLSRAWSQRNIHKKRSQSKVQTAISNGMIQKPSRCVICLEEGQIQGHHPDYSKPLEVMWLCVKCHAKIHKYEKLKSKIS